MLIGLSSAKAKTTSVVQDDIFDVDVSNFEKLVIVGSTQRPILVEFWAPWCGPCKQLMPLLERVVIGQNGKVALAKVNIDENPELAQAFRVQSVPMVVAMMEGQPVTAFAGVRPPVEIENLVSQLISHAQKKQPQALDVGASLKEAQQFTEQHKYLDAINIYMRILDFEPEHSAAYIGLILNKIYLGHLEEAEALMERAVDGVRKDAQFTGVALTLDLIRKVPQGDMAAVQQDINTDPQNCTAYFFHAELCFAKNLREQAAESLLTILKINQAWENGKARAQLLKYLEAWGVSDPVGLRARRKLSALLFS